MIRLSANELAALLRNVFQAQFGHSQDWEAMSKTVLWLEMRGHGGVAMLSELLEMDGKLAPFSSKIREAGADLHVDMNGKSLILAAHCLADLIVDVHHGGGRVNLHIMDARHHLALYAMRMRCERQGMPKDALKIVCDEPWETARSVEDAEAHTSKAYQNGIPISYEAYEFLSRVGDEVLVESTESSRRGAGE